MNSVNWKKVVLVIVGIFLLLQCKRMMELVKDQSYDLVNDLYDYIWSLPQGLRFALISAFFLMLLVMLFRILTTRKGGDDKNTY